MSMTSVPYLKFVKILDKLYHNLYLLINQKQSLTQELLQKKTIITSYYILYQNKTIFLLNIKFIKNTKKSALYFSIQF